MADYYTMAWHPTEYNGITYRSSLEAQWARFFTRLGIPFRYEPKQFVLGYWMGQLIYTPDFGLLGCPYHYVEIKPKYPDDKVILKCATLSGQSVNVAIIYGKCHIDEFRIMFFESGKEVVHRPQWVDFFKFRRDRWVDMKKVVGRRRGFVKAMGK